MGSCRSANASQPTQIQNSTPTMIKINGALIGSQGRGAVAGPVPHPPFNPCVRFSRTRLNDDVLDMVTQPSDSEWFH